MPGIAAPRAPCRKLCENVYMGHYQGTLLLGDHQRMAETLLTAQAGADLSIVDLGDVEAEERLKTVNQAYAALKISFA